MPGIFISYRRHDAISATGRVTDALTSHFGRQNIFRDITTIHPGDDYVVKIEEFITACDVLLVVIGPRWLAAMDATGQRRRLDDPDDEHRIEIATALQRGVRVIPVLVEGAQMPSQQDLPPALAALARRQAVALADDHHWAYDIQQLISAIETVIQGRAQQRGRAWPFTASAVASLIAAGWLVGVAVGEAGGFYDRLMLGPVRLSTSYAYGGALAAAVTALVVAGGAIGWRRLGAIVVLAGLASWLLDAAIYSAIRLPNDGRFQSLGRMLGHEAAPGEVVKFASGVVCAVVVGLLVVYLAGWGRERLGTLVLALALGGALGVAGEGILKVALDHVPWLPDPAWTYWKDRGRLTVWLVAAFALIGRCLARGQSRGVTATGHDILTPRRVSHP